MTTTTKSPAETATEQKTPAAADLSWYHYPKQFEQFLSNTENHVMKVLHHDGLYRHLRFQEPGTTMWHFDIITWPGRLAIVGDIGGGHIFTRTEDMLQFFDQGQPLGHINADYWAEKLDGGRPSVKAFSHDQFTKVVREQAAETVADLDPERHADFKAEVDDLIDSVDWFNESAHEAVADFRFDGEAVWSDTWEFDFNDYDHHFLIGLHAILWAAKKYHAEYRP